MTEFQSALISRIARPSKTKLKEKCRKIRVIESTEIETIASIDNGGRRKKIFNCLSQLSCHVVYIKKKVDRRAAKQ